MSLTIFYRAFGDGAQFSLWDERPGSSQHTHEGVCEFWDVREIELGPEESYWRMSDRDAIFCVFAEIFVWPNKTEQVKT